MAPKFEQKIKKNYSICMDCPVERTSTCYKTLRPVEGQLRIQDTSMLLFGLADSIRGYVKPSISFHLHRLHLRSSKVNTIGMVTNDDLYQKLQHETACSGEFGPKPDKPRNTTEELPF